MTVSKLLLPVFSSLRVAAPLLLVLLMIALAALLAARGENLDADGHFNRAEKFAGRGRFVEAIEDYTRAIALDPEHFKSYRKRAVAHMYLGDYPKAIADHNQALARNPANGRVYYDRGISFYFLENTEAACHDMQRACNLGFQNGCVQVRLGC